MVCVSERKGFADNRGMMSTVLKWIAVFISCLVLQSTLMNAVSILGITPDVTVIALFLLAINHGSLAGLYAGFLLGLSQDLYSPSILGQQALAKTLVGAATGLFNVKVMRTDPLLRMFLLLLAFIFHDSIFLIASVIKNSSSLSLLGKELITETIPRSLYSMLLLLLLYAWSYFVAPFFKK
ncbi:MAG: rod shape-determining protein MreD [Chitinivibrionales bacterium]|nr:rod shape-determining protein MreD [Chitinivibrionales bacterium]